MSTPTEITRDNAVEMLQQLNEQEQRLAAQLEITTDPAERAAIYREVATVQQSQTLACERRPGRSRDKQPAAARIREETKLTGTAAEIEQLRAAAAGHGLDLPDPRALLTELREPAAIAALIALYTTASRAA